jgi:hypothetical protein
MDFQAMRDAAVFQMVKLVQSNFDCLARRWNAQDLSFMRADNACTHAGTARRSRKSVVKSISRKSNFQWIQRLHHLQEERVLLPKISEIEEATAVVRRRRLSDQQNPHRRGAIFKACNGERVAAFH